MIAKSHHALLTSEEYYSMREFCVGSKLIKEESIKEQAAADLRKQGLGYIETMIHFNLGCLQKGRDIITRVVVCAYQQNIMQKVSNTERRL